jgi:hypothetical protein
LMRPRKAKQGDVLAIPLGRGCGWAIARVLFVSGYFKDVMLMAVSPMVAPDLGAVECLEGKSSNEMLLYTAAIKIRKRGWEILRSCPVDDEDEAKTLRIVAGEVWLKDEVVRSVTREDEASLKVMLVHGHQRVEEVIADFLRKRGAL